MRIYSIFNSIDGEVNYYGQGTFSTFIRFAGCNLQCKYCDTEYARERSSGKDISIEDVLTVLNTIGCKKVTITGGEPLCQSQELLALTRKLWHLGYSITIETNGSLLLEGYGISSWVVDYKLPSSGMMKEMNLSIFPTLRSSDYIKFVMTDKEDYKVATALVKSFKANEPQYKAKIAFSPAYPLDPNTLISWIKEDKLFDVQLNLQIHKIAKIDEKNA